MSFKTIKMIIITLLISVFITIIVYLFMDRFYKNSDKQINEEKIIENNVPVYEEEIGEDNNDTYANFSDLAKVEKLGVDFDIKYREKRESKSMIIAIHGGGIEAGTSELAKATADNLFSYYIFEGIKRNENRDLHTSTNFDEPVALNLVGKSLRTLSLHGYSDSTEKKTYIGGLDKSLKKAIKDELESKGFSIEEAPSEFNSDSPRNIVNRNKQKMGVQLELSTALRQSFFTNDNLSRKNRDHTTEEFNRYVTALQQAMERVENH